MIIIARECVTFNELVLTYDEGGMLFAEIMDRFTANMSCEKKAWVYAWIGNQKLCDRDMSWGLSGADIKKLIDGFAELDKKYPYQKEQ